MIKSRISTIAAIIIAVLICTSFMIPEQITIPSNMSWTKTKYTIGIGEKIEFISSGEISPTTNVKCNPDGIMNRADLTNLAVIKTSNFGCLIGKVGENGTPFYVGTKQTITSENNGDLYLGINDTNLKDNTGDFIVTVTPTKVPPTE